MLGTTVSTRKFDSAYHQKTEKEISAEKAMQLKAVDLKGYTLQYKDYLLCPKCKKAHICLVRGEQQPFFRTCPNSLHADNCGLAPDEMSPCEVDSFVKDEKNYSEIQRQMERVLVLQFGKDQTEINLGGSVDAEESETVKATKTSNKVSKYIPRKCITSKIYENDVGVKKFFYGDVEVQWEKGNPIQQGNANGGKSYMKLLIRTPRTEGKQRFICRLNVSPAVYAHIPKEITSPERYTCKIVFLAELRCPKGKEYLTGWLIRSEFIRTVKEMREEYAINELNPRNNPYTNRGNNE